MPNINKLIKKNKRDTGYEHLIKLNGISGFVFSIKNAGKQITISGWNSAHWNYNIGDRVLLIRENGEETRYKIEKVTHSHVPGDQYFIVCSFDPRR